MRAIYKYKYNGKELQDELGLNMYDYGARNYDPALGRWMNIDSAGSQVNNFLSNIFSLTRTNGWSDSAADQRAIFNGFNFRR